VNVQVQVAMIESLDIEVQRNTCPGTRLTVINSCEVQQIKYKRGTVRGSHTWCAESESFPQAPRTKHISNAASYFNDIPCKSR
jgi:hypothetical protein